MTQRMRPSYWQRRYLLRHYRRYGDEDLAQAAGLPVSTAAAFLQSQGATRSLGELRRIARNEEPPPPKVTPETVRVRLTHLRSRPLTHIDRVLLAASFLASLLLYVLTSARTVTGEDAGELLAAAHGFGVPHPPGYPLWLLLAWLADHGLPFGTVAFRVTLVSSVFSAGAVTLLLAVALKTVRSRLAAFAGAAFFAVSLTHWTQAVIPEVYGLNSFFVALCALLLVRLAERPTTARLLTLSLATGLSLTNHTTALPVAVLVALGALLIAPRLCLRPSVTLRAALVGLAPLLLYLVLPLASARDPYVDWGNPETLPALWDHVTRAQYTANEAVRQTEGSYADYLRRLAVLGDAAARQFGWRWVLVLPVVGFFVLMFRQTGVWLYFVAVGYVCSVGVTRYTAFSFDREHLYANQIFWIPAWMTLAWLAAGGVDVVVAGLRRALRRVRPAADVLATLGLAGLVLVPATEHMPRADRSELTIVREYGRALLDVMEPRALYFPSSDHSTFAVLYWQGVHGYRPDVTIADKFGRIDRELVEPHLDDVTREALASLPPTRHRRPLEACLIRGWDGPVYFANKRDMSDVPDLVLEPVGPLFRVMSKEESQAWRAPAVEGAIPPALQLWGILEPVLRMAHGGRYDITAQMIVSDLLYMRGVAQLRCGDVDAAVASWTSIEADLAPLKQIRNNIGSALAEEGRAERAIRFYEQALDEDPRYVLALRNKALVYRNRGDSSAAITTLRTLLQAEPKHREARLELARLLARTDATTVEALAEYEALAKADRHDPLPWREAGRLLHRIGDRPKAEAAYVEALRLDPEQEDVAEWLARLRRGIDLLAVDGPTPASGDVHGHGVAPSVPDVPPGTGVLWEYDPMLGIRVPKLPDRR